MPLRFWAGSVAIGLGGLVAASLHAATATVDFATSRPAFETLREEVWPAAFRGKSLAEIEATWPAWARQRDAEIRARVAGGDADSAVNLMLFGSSFTTAPRASSQDLASLITDPPRALVSLSRRIDDFAATIVAPGPNERMTLVREVIAREGIDVRTPAGRAALRRYLDQRALALGQSGANQLSAMVERPDAMGTIYRARGLSTDTALSVDFGLDRTIDALRTAGAVDAASMRRVAIIGPGLDFIDKQTGHDFYPEQTIQPFALIDSLRRTGLAAGMGVEIVAFDLSPRVLQHIARAGERARAGVPYTVVLTRTLERSFTPAFVSYWDGFGGRIGKPSAAPAPPPSAGKVAVRAVAVGPDVVRSIEPRDLNVVLQRDPADTGRFDLVVATNVLLYYDVFEQSVALANIAALLRPGGLLLTNTRLIELPGIPMAEAGYTDSVYTSLPGLGETGDRIYWYARR